MKVPLLDLNAQNLALEIELKAAFDRVLKSGHFILGPEVESFEKEIAQLVDVPHAIGISSGTDALLLALMALEIGPGDEVICPSFTFFATAGCIARVGATPVFADSRIDTFNIDPQDIQKKITSRTKAIIPVHLFGQSAEMDRIMEIAKQHKLFVIEDAAQALGASYKGKKVGGMGTFGAFSFFPSKNLGGFGDGGMLVTNDDTLAEKAKILRIHGAKPKYFNKFVGGNFRLDALQAALLRVKLPHYDEYTRKRKANAAYYTENLGKILKEKFGNLENSPIILPSQDLNCDHIWNQYTLRISGDGNRDKFQKFLNESEIGNEIYYPKPMHLQECFAGYKNAHAVPKISEILSKQSLSIPIFPELKRDQAEEVVLKVTNFFRSLP